jgi:hypothetical protein
LTQDPESLAAAIDNHPSNTHIMAEIAGGVAFPHWYRKWKGEGIDATRANIQDIHDRLGNLHQLPFGEQSKTINEAIQAAHQTGGMIDYINGEAENRDMNGIDLERLNELSNSGEHTKRWDKELKGMFKSELMKAPIIHDDPRNPMTVIRVQNEEGHGPYGAELPVLDRHGASIAVTPPPYADRGFSADDTRRLAQSPTEAPNVKFGFKNPEEMHRWFTPEELTEMKSHGFAPQKVQASKVWGSGKQVFFEKFVKPHRAKKLKAVLSTKAPKPGKPIT